MTAAATGLRRPAGRTEPRPSVGRETLTAWPRVASASLAAATYVALAVGLFWHVWSVSPSGVMSCDCTDAGRTVWYLEWFPFALGHGHGLLHSTYQFHPGGFNLLTDTSVPAVAILFSPVTTLWGPVVSMNTASTLVPAATAFSMYWLLRRWVRWAPAAFVGGLAYGFSAWVVVQLAFGWINLACVALLPLMVAALDDLLVRQRRKPALMGAVLALLLVVEFFVSIEMTLLVVISMAVGTALLTAGAGLWAREELRRRRRHATTGLGVAALMTAVLLAYPVWFFVAGPSHLSGSVWTTNVPGSLGNIVGNLWDPVGHWGSVSSRFLAAEARTSGGYAGGVPGPSASYLGWGLLAVLVGGLAVWRRDRRLWLFGALGLITFLLSLQAGPGHWGPWSLVQHLPILDNVVQYRFAGVFVLCAAVMLGIVVDRTHTGVLSAFGARSRHRVQEGRPSRSANSARALGTLAAALVSAVAIVPIARTFDLPLVMLPVTVPPWFLDAAPRLPPGTVLATYPFPTADSQSAIPWQALAGMPYQMAGGGGPSGTLPRAGRDKPGFAVLAAASTPTSPEPTLTDFTLAAVRQALHDWRVTQVVVPGDRGLLPFQTGRGTAYGVAFFTAVLGSPPRSHDGSWVWRDPDASPPPIPVSPVQLAACLAIPSRSVPASAPSGTPPWSACVLSPGPTR